MSINSALRSGRFREIAPDLRQEGTLAPAGLRQNTGPFALFVLDHRDE